MAYAHTISTAAPQVQRATPNLREASFEDFEQIAALATENGIPPNRTAQEWQELWITNPAYESAGRKWPIGWVLESKGQVVGYIGSIPTRYRFGSEELLCGNGYSLVVAAPYRGYTLFLLDRFARQNSAELLMSNTVGGESFKSLSAVGFAPVPAGQWDRSSAWVTRYVELCSDRLARKSVPFPQLLAPSAAALVAGKDSWNRFAVAKRIRRGCDLAVVSRFDERFDQFWRELSREYPNKLIAFRNRRTLEWHFRSAARENRLYVITLTEDSKLRAYGTFVHLASKPGDPIHRMNLADFQSLDSDDRFYFTILHAALKLCRRLRINVLSTNGISASGVDVSTLAPYHFELAYPAFIYRGNDPAVNQKLANPSAWCPSFYDGDASL